MSFRVAALALAALLSSACGDGGSSSPSGGAGLDADRLAESPGYAAYQRGQAQVAAGDHEAAALAFAEAVAADGAVAEFEIRLTRALFESSQFNELARVVPRALAAHPDHPELIVAEGLVLWQQHQLEPATQRFEAAIALDERDADAHYWLGRTLAYQGIIMLGSKAINFDALGRAVREFKRAMELEPGNVEYISQAGQCHARMREYPQARALLEQALGIDPEHTTSLRVLGKVLFWEGAFDESLEVFERAVRLNSEDAELQHDLGLLLLEFDRTERAERAFRRAIQLAPANPKPYFQLGTILSRRGEDAGAEEMFTAHEDWLEKRDQLDGWRMAVRDKRDDPSTLYQLGLAHARVFEYDHALMWFVRATTLDEQHAQAFFEAGKLLLERGDLEQAYPYFSRAAELKPSGQKILEWFGRLLVQMGRLDEARVTMTRLSRLRPKDATLVFNLGLLASSQEDYAEAIEMLTRATELDPGYIRAHVALGRLYVSTGSWEQAVERLQIARTLDPANAEIQSLLDQALAGGKR